jgi:hypothetical protein
MSESRPLETTLKILPVIGACVTFAWGVWVWKNNADDERDAAEAESVRHAESRRIEASRPFLEMQLKLYTEAAQVTARIANGSGDVEADKRRFWELYTGELSMVEDGAVSGAMVDFKTAMEHNADQEELRRLGVTLARKMRESLATSWGTDAWQMNAKKPPTP